MAQKFVEAIGLHNVFNVSGTTLDITSIKSSAQSKVNQNSIVFLIATSDDEQYGYNEGSKYIWTRNRLYPTNDFDISNISVDSSTLKYLKGSISDNTIEFGVVIQDISTATQQNDGVASAYNVKQLLGNTKDEKVKVSKSTDSNIYPLMAIAANNPSDGSTYEAIYDSGLKINPGSHNIISGSYDTDNANNVSANGTGAIAFGTIYAGSDCNVQSNGENSLAFGVIDVNEASDNVIVANGDGAIAGGALGNEQNIYNSSIESSGQGSVAYGYVDSSNNIINAEGNAAIAIGYNNVQATGLASQAYGSETIASGNYSHAEGLGTQALYEAEHAEGTYNKSNNISNIEFIDLGLPSGTKWAKYNIGATNGNTAISWYGNYYSWAEINARIVDYNEGTCQPPCNWNNYQYANGAYNKLTKYCPSDKADYWDGDGSPDGLISLEDSDNIAIQTLGGQWTMPTKEQLQELYEETDYEWITDYQDISGLNGYVFRGNEQELFLPAAGYCDFSELDYVGNGGYYWSSSLNEDNPSSAWNLYFDSNNIDLNNDYRYSGFSVRPVISDFTFSNGNASETRSNTEMHTLHSVGIGTSDEDRRNAIEIMSNGNIYINGVGNYDGTNPADAETLQNSLADLISITYEDLLNKVNSKSLIPGKKYLITDYITKINNSDFTSLEKKYDGIVCEAISNSELSKVNCKAILSHEGSGANEDVYIWVDNIIDDPEEFDPIEDYLQQYHDDWSGVFNGDRLLRIGKIEFDNESYWLWKKMPTNDYPSDDSDYMQFVLTSIGDFEGNTIVDDVTKINRPILYYLNEDMEQIDYDNNPNLGTHHNPEDWVVIRQEKYTYNPNIVSSNKIYVEKFATSDIDWDYYYDTDFYQEGAGPTNEYTLKGTLEWDDNEFYLWELTNGHALDVDQFQYSWMLTKTADFTELSLQDNHNSRYCPCYCFLNEDKSEAYGNGSSYGYNTHEILLIQAVYDPSEPEVKPLSGGGGETKIVEYEIGYDITKQFDGHKGTILYMQDEYGNSANFDFKNIKSKKYGFLFGGENDLTLDGTYKENKVLGELREFSICSETCYGSTFTQNCLGTIYQDLENCEVSYDNDQFVVFDPYHHETLNTILIEHQKNIEDIDAVTSSLLVNHEDRIRELEAKIEQLINA